MSINNLLLIGNLVETPLVQVTTGGAARARFRMASTERRRDPASGAWVDGESVFIAVTCWRKLAEHVGNSLEKGDRVLVSGRLRQWVAEKDGVRRTVHEIEADAVGPDLQRSMVTVARPRRASSEEVVAGAEVGGSGFGDAGYGGAEFGGFASGSALDEVPPPGVDENGVLLAGGAGPDALSGAAPDEVSAGTADAVPDDPEWLPPLAASSAG